MKHSSSVQEEIAEEIKKRLAEQAKQYEKRFNGPTRQTKKRWAKKIVQQVEAEKAQLSFDFMDL